MPLAEFEPNKPIEVQRPTVWDSDRGTLIDFEKFILLSSMCESAIADMHTLN